MSDAQGWTVSEQEKKAQALATQMELVAGTFAGKVPAGVALHEYAAALVYAKDALSEEHAGEESECPLCYAYIQVSKVIGAPALPKGGR